MSAKWRGWRPGVTGLAVSGWGIAAVGVAFLTAGVAIGPSQAGSSPGAKVTVQNETGNSLRVWIYNSDDMAKAVPTEQKDLSAGASQQFGCNSKGACRVVVQLWLGQNVGYQGFYDLGTYSRCVMVAVQQGGTSPVGQIC